MTGALERLRWAWSAGNRSGRPSVGLTGRVSWAGELPGAEGCPRHLARHLLLERPVDLRQGVLLGHQLLVGIPVHRRVDEVDGLLQVARLVLEHPDDPQVAADEQVRLELAGQAGVDVADLQVAPAVA